MTSDLWCRQVPLEDAIVPRPYPNEFREDVIAVARRREGGVTLAQITMDFGISGGCCMNW